MSVRCAIVGHVRDSTEFEQREVERPDGTVLVCREYHVCRRCGHREEIYRNEQILAPREPEPDSTGGERSSEVEIPDGVGDDSAGIDTAQLTEGDTAESAVVDTGEIIEDETTDKAEDTSDEADDTEVVTTAVSTDVAGDSKQAVADGAGATTVEDDAIILSDSSTDSASRTRDRDTESTADTPTHEGTVGTDVWTDSSSDTPTDGDGLRCRNCGVEWRTQTTTLRDGDLCPECRIGYVET